MAWFDGGVAAPWIVDDGLWSVVEPLLPPRRPGKRGPVPISDRRCLQGILFILYTGIGWEDLPQELGFGSGMTCWRRLRRWTDTGVFERLHRVLLAELNAAGELDWSKAMIDAGHIRSKKGAHAWGLLLLDRRRPGSKHHVACDGGGIPLAVVTTGGNVPDVTCAIELVDAIGPVAGRPGRPRRRPETVLADKGYDSHRVREALQHRRITPVIPKRGTVGIIGLGKIRWVVERTIAWLHQYKRLATRWEHHTDLHNSLISLACSLICWRRLKTC